jgi:hypothetical protein
MPSRGTARKLAVERPGRPCRGPPIDPAIARGVFSLKGLRREAQHRVVQRGTL